MYFDVNAWLGHWPFRPLPITTAGGLLRQMDRYGIEKAAVASLHAVFYRDCHAGNEELFRQVRRHRDRLLPQAVVNPTYPGWREDLKACRERCGMAGLRLVPQYHNYRLQEGEAQEAAAAAAELGMPVALPLRLEDRRNRHWMDSAPDLGLGEIEDFVRRCSGTTFFILEGHRLEGSALVAEPGLRARVYFEISRLASVLQETIPRLIEAAGPGRLMFGTGMAIKTPAPAVLKVEALQAPKRVQEGIAFRNAAQALGVA